MTMKIAIGVSVTLALFALAIAPVLANGGTLTVERSEDRLSATASWTPSAGAESQVFIHVGRHLLGEGEPIGIGVHLDSWKEFPLDGAADSLDITELDPRREYIYVTARTDLDDDGKVVYSDIAFVGLPAPTSAATDRAALVALYNATDGANWRDNAKWLTDAPIGEWSGVTTDADGRVTELDLWLNKLSGELPPELGDLAKLQRLNLSLNDLDGGLPPELGNLYALQDMTLIGNKFTGEIPIQYGGLFNLQKIYLSVGNAYAGCVPAALSHVPANDLSDLTIPFCS